MPKTLTQLRIVKRGDLYVVHIGKRKFFTKKWYWQDMKDHFSDIRATHINVKGVPGLPIAETQFPTQNEAETFCEVYLLKEREEIKSDKEIKTYNTGLLDIYWPQKNIPPVPKIKPAKPELESGGTGIPPRPFKCNDDKYSRIE